MNREGLRVFTGSVAVALVLSFIIWLPQQFVNRTIGLGDPEIDLVFSIIELIALLLPALAIMLQIMVRFTERPALVLSGEATSSRQAVYGFVGFGGIACVISLSILLAYLDLPTPLYASIVMASTAVYVFSFLPAVAWLRLRDTRLRDVSDLLEGVGSYHELKRIEQFSDEELSTLVDALDLTSPVEFADDFDAQTQLTDDRFW